jgi:hypothetical protein
LAIWKRVRRRLMRVRGQRVLKRRGCAGLSRVFRLSVSMSARVCSVGRCWLGVPMMSACVLLLFDICVITSLSISIAICSTARC